MHLSTQLYELIERRLKSQELFEANELRYLIRVPTTPLEKFFGEPDGIRHTISGKLQFLWKAATIEKGVRQYRETRKRKFYKRYRKEASQ